MNPLLVYWISEQHMNLINQLNILNNFQLMNTLRIMLKQNYKDTILQKKWYSFCLIFLRIILLVMVLHIPFIVMSKTSGTEIIWQKWILHLVYHYKMFFSMIIDFIYLSFYNVINLFEINNILFYFCVIKNNQIKTSKTKQKQRINTTISYHSFNSIIIMLTLIKKDNE